MDSEMQTHPEYMGHIAQDALTGSRQKPEVHDVITENMIITGLASSFRVD